MLKLFSVNMDADAALARLEPVLRSGYVAEGPQSRAFEAALRERLGYPYAQVLSSGTAALSLAAHLASLGEGDYVITTPLTCLITNEVLALRRCRLLWADVDPDTGNLDPDAVRRLLVDGDVRAIVCVDWGGSTLGVPDLRHLAVQYGAVVIEDAAHAFGAIDDADGKPVGSGQSDFTCVSFQAIKTLTCGDGGLLTCRHAHHSERARLLRWFGLDRTKSESMRSYQQVPEPGFKLHLNDIAAAVGLANLPHLDEWIGAARDTAAFYDRAFAGTRVRPLDRSAGSSCWLYSVRVPDASGFIAAMAARGIECSQVHSRNDTQAIWARFHRPLPGMTELEHTLVCLPVGPHVTREDAVAVAEAAIAVTGPEPPSQAAMVRLG